MMKVITNNQQRELTADQILALATSDQTAELIATLRSRIEDLIAEREFWRELAIRKQDEIERSKHAS